LQTVVCCKLYDHCYVSAQILLLNAVNWVTISERRHLSSLYLLQGISRY